MIDKALDGLYDTIKVVFINTWVFTFISLADVETVLKIVLLMLTIVYTTFKIFQHIKNNKANKNISNK